MPTRENAALYKRYEAEADAQTDVTFVGRLATYKYYNMDQVVAQALTTFKRLRERHERQQTQEISLLTRRAAKASAALDDA